MIGFDRHSLGCLENGHRCEAGQQLDHHAFMRWIEMLYQNEGHAVIGWQCGEKSPACIQPDRRGTNPDEWEISDARRRVAGEGATTRFSPVRLAVWHDCCLSRVPAAACKPEDLY